MKLLQVTGALLLTSSALAQQISIGSPVPAQALTIGEPFTVEVDEGDQLTGLTEVSLVIGLQSCGSNPCAPTGDQVLGQILYSGSFAPERHEGSKPPYQNFTFNLADTLQPQNAVIHVSHFYLLGAGPEPVLETKNVSVTLTQAPTSAKFRRGGL